MAARELMRNGATRYCVFYIDSFNSDGKNLPTSKESGKEDLSLSAPCSFGSIAKESSGKQYVLNGKDKWIVFQNQSGNAGSSDEMTDIEWEEL